MDVQDRIDYEIKREILRAHGLDPDRWPYHSEAAEPAEPDNGGED